MCSSIPYSRDEHWYSYEQRKRWFLQWNESVIPNFFLIMWTVCLCDRQSVIVMDNPSDHKNHKIWNLITQSLSVTLSRLKRVAVSPTKTAFFAVVQPRNLGIDHRVPLIFCVSVCVFAQFTENILPKNVHHGDPFRRMSNPPRFPCLPPSLACSGRLMCNQEETP